ncbi:methyltransferase domain-containing protein [Cylindrobasidium torrendii FP15055 ss-10]|uniref:Alpha N-terminal protein methyltransferase 1 n=1 Tax=Cylindrobasidium torrendii FP15055 ss-10 TaxID=1314674 RepID=A0A0D7BRF6_9AGAR|nr:methyltransferase domain-containing protein [Cylindrobasidium torrendii FP15055 ss-10]
MADIDDREPNLQEGIEYWNNQPATYDGVLGGFGEGSLPRIDALGSRLFLLNHLPELSTVSSALKLLHPLPKERRTRALDVGAGVGRVTADVLLYLVDDVLLLEPVAPFINEAVHRAKNPDPKLKNWKGLTNKTTSVTFIQGPLQAFDPAHPLNTTDVKLLERVGSQQDDLESGFDVVWCQWCLGHLSDEQLSAFFKRARTSLRDPERSLMVVKENVCRDTADNQPRISYDEEDSSLTRSDLAWKSVFHEAGLTLVSEKVQTGLPEGIYVVKMYALR